MAAIFFCHECGLKLGDHFSAMVLIATYFVDYAAPVVVHTTGVDAKQAIAFLASVSQLEHAGCVITTEVGLHSTSIKPLGLDTVPEDAEIRQSGCPVWCMDKRHVHERV
jgi:hypothetical protein